MNTEECVWYSARNEDGSCQINLDDSYLRIYLSIGEVRNALNRHIAKYNSQGTTYIICKTTYRVTLNEAGQFAKAESIVEAVETCRKEKAV